MNTNSTYEEVVAEFATKLHIHINGDAANVVDLLGYDIPYIKQMITMISTVYDRTYELVDDDIATQLSILDGENNA